MRPGLRIGLEAFILLCGLWVTSSAQVIWHKSPKNPVIRERDEVDDPFNLKFCLEPDVMYDSSMGGYRMWFTQLTNEFNSIFRIASAASFDGEEWYISVNSPVYSGGIIGSFDYMARSPRVIKSRSGFLMYYTGQAASAAPQYAMGLATSPDGKSWFRYGFEPILHPGLPGSWDPSAQAFGSVLRNGDSTYSMWFAGNNGVHGGIGLATSPDGVNWTESPANPLLVPRARSWDSVTVVSPCVVLAHQVYYMFYLGASQPGTFLSIGLATSNDGIHWTRFGQGPILSPGSGWEGTSLGNLAVVFKDEIFHMWYSGLSSLTRDWQIGYATSPYTPLSVSAEKDLLVEYSLIQNFPNPFNPITVIRYQIPVVSNVRLTVYDLLGQVVDEPVNEKKAAGSYEIKYDATGLASGVYFYRLTAGNFVQTRKMVYVR